MLWYQLCSVAYERSGICWTLVSYSSCLLFKCLIAIQICFWMWLHQCEHLHDSITFYMFQVRRLEVKKKEEDEGSARGPEKREQVLSLWTWEQDWAEDSPCCLCLRWRCGSNGLWHVDTTLKRLPWTQGRAGAWGKGNPPWKEAAVRPESAGSTAPAGGHILCDKSWAEAKYFSHNMWC